MNQNNGIGPGTVLSLVSLDYAAHFALLIRIGRQMIITRIGLVMMDKRSDSGWRIADRGCQICGLIKTRAWQKVKSPSSIFLIWPCRLPEIRLSRIIEIK